MRNLTFIVPFAVTAALAGAALAEPASVNVTVGAQLQDKVEELGPREVREQSDRLVQLVTQAVAETPALNGARIDLVLTDLKPNRPTFQQISERPGLDPMRSISIGGAEIEGQITLADGTVQPVRYEWFSNTLADVRGFTTWQDADRAFRRFSSNLATGRYVNR
ncbi:hypothetical protein [Brevundimonas sp.]|jgi:hypothetical protein|uniref:hypothetical protein n=1 Tax=Brevundimonas sp. TaxID=1871086 RepID=UPI0025C6E2F2|nr:hypothetical protein [Brevundimonas sp.]